MLNSRSHAAIDCGLLAGLAAVAVAPRTEGAVRWTAALAAAGQAGTMVLTNYEGGIAPRQSFQRHRRLDIVGGSVLGVAGALLGSRSLFALGAATTGTALFSAARAHDAPHMLYTPLDVPKPFAPDVWLVDGDLGPGVPVRMTVLRLPDRSLLLHSPTRLTPPLRRALEALGPIKHLVAPNSVHWMFAKAWQDAVPEARTYGAPGLRERKQVRQAGLRIDEVLRDEPPAAWGGAVDQVVVPGGAGFREVVQFHRPSRTVLMTDLVHNFEPRKLPWVLRPLAWLLGNMSPTSRAPAHLRALVRLGPTAAQRDAARRIVQWHPDRVVVTHGAPLTLNAAERLRASLAWLTR